ncbi:hypothetical protein HYW21_05175 [Candidatus Woesearchaeota archaeon]|nr:hypothetical protein [Candidatus Woesearchaeota archaeon]
MNDCKRIGKNIFTALMKDHQFLTPYYRQWQHYRKELQEYYTILNAADLSRCSEEEFLNYFMRFNELYLQEYAMPVITNSFAFFAENHLKELLGKHAEQYFIELTHPSKPSFSSRCESSLLTITEGAKKQGLKSKAVQQMITLHVKQFHWVENNYERALFLGKEHVEHEVKKRFEKAKGEQTKITQNYETGNERKKEILDTLHASHELQLLVEFIDFFIHWQDDRKAACLEALYYQHEFLKEIVKRTSLPLEEVAATIYTEIPYLLNGKIDRKMLQERWQHAVIFMTTDQKLHLYTNKEAALLTELVLPSPTQTTTLQGTVASRGEDTTIRGKARIILTIDRAKHMQDGDILVTSMTRPDMVPLMKKARAIITNEGGITCHAAVICRELHIPCIIGTKVGTKVLKDGNDIELDLKIGKITIITHTD